MTSKLLDVSFQLPGGADGVFDAGSPPAMAAPGSVSHDPVAANYRRQQLAEAAIATIGEHATMFATQVLDPDPR